MGKATGLACELGAGQMNTAYDNTGKFFAVTAFFATYIYAIATFGVFLGIGAGWLPAMIVAAFVRAA